MAKPDAYLGLIRYFLQAIKDGSYALIKISAYLIGPETRPSDTTAPTTLSISGTSAEAGPLAAGLYVMNSSPDAAFRQGNTGQTAVFATDRKIRGGIPRLLVVTGTSDQYVAVITQGGTDTMTFEKIGA